jgi:hypothetical protein
VLPTEEDRLSRTFVYLAQERLKSDLEANSTVNWNISAVNLYYMLRFRNTKCYPEDPKRKEKVTSEV